MVKVAKAPVVPGLVRHATAAPAATVPVEAAAAVEPGGTRCRSRSSERSRSLRGRRSRPERGAQAAAAAQRGRGRETRGQQGRPGRRERLRTPSRCCSSTGDIRCRTRTRYRAVPVEDAPAEGPRASSPIPRFCRGLARRRSTGARRLPSCQPDEHTNASTQRAGKPDERDDAEVDGGALDALNGAHVEAGCFGEFFLREIKPPTDAHDVGRDAAENLGVGALGRHLIRATEGPP